MTAPTVAGSPTNADVSAVLDQVADLLHVRGGDEYRVRAFRNAARIVDALPEPAGTLLRVGRLDSVPGIGEGILHRVKQVLRTGSCDDRDRLLREVPPGLVEMLQVRGVGAPTVRAVWTGLRIDTVAGLERAALDGRLLALPRMGPTRVHRLLQAIEEHRSVRAGKRPWVDARRIGQQLADGLATVPGVRRSVVAGSVRRGKALCGDLDILVAADDPEAVSARAITLPRVERVLIQGTGRIEVLLDDQQQVDVRVLAAECFGAGMHYFTGSAQHNIALRTRALRYGVKVSDDGLFVRDTTTRIAPGTQEEEIFQAARLPWIPPELRENTGEIEAAAAGRLPRLVETADLHGDLHCHTRASDGRGTAREMVDAARGLGHRYLAITDHTRSLEIANGLDERRLLAQREHLRAVQDEVGDAMRVLAGVEVDILPDGSLDIDRAVLSRLDWVVASVHLALDMDGPAMTDRLIAAMESGVVDVIGHPTNRRLGERRGAVLDLERLLAAASRTGVCLEVNGNPHRMDLDDVACRSAREAGVPLVISTDAHAPAHLQHREFGVITARRGWVGPEHVANAGPWERLARRRADRLAQRPVGSIAGWTPAAEVYAGVARSAHWDDVASAPAGEDLGVSLAARPLSPEVRQRLDDWLRNGGDPPLEAALRQLGEPMAVAFGLWSGPTASG